MDLRVLIAQMQTDAFAWSTVTFVGSADSVALVHEAKALSKKVMDQLAHESDLPPPLEDDAPADDVPALARDGDEPPPLEAATSQDDGFVKVDRPPMPASPATSEAPPPLE